MPLVYQQNINATTKIGVWHIAEAEDFFLRQVPLHRAITHWHKRLQHLAGRLLLKELYPEFPLGEILIADTKKPFLKNEAWHFSISHSGDYAAAMVSKEFRVGVDVESPSPKIADIKHKFLGEEEWAVGSGQFAEGSTQHSTFNIQHLTLCWSVKEAVYKWWGIGGVDFKKDIIIKAISGTADQGSVHCVFKNDTLLDVHFLHTGDNYLTWVLTS
jgi:phosphopantetheinyl transferase